MKTIKRLKMLIIATVLIISTQAFSQDHANMDMMSLSSKDKAAINKVLDDFGKNYVANNLDAVMAAFTEQAVYLEGRGIDDGKKAIREDHLASHFASSTYLMYKSRDRVINGAGDVAYVHEMVNRQSKKNDSEAATPARERRVLYVLEKQSNGTWLIALLN